MNTINIGRHKFSQPIEHISLLQKVSQDYVNGCLKVFGISQQWSIYFEEGKIIYACQSQDMWEIFCKTIQQLKPDIPGLSNEVYQHLKTIFDSNIDDEGTENSDYLAICWLVNQQYLTASQAAKLIEALAIAVMDSYFKLRDGIYEFASQTFLNNLPKFCYIDVSVIAKSHQQLSHSLSKFVTPVYQPGNHLFSELSQRELATIGGLIEPQCVPLDNKYSNSLNQIKTDHPTSQPEMKVKKTALYKVMCVDDSPTILKAIQGFLDEEIFNVIGVDDPLKALMQILRIKPDIVLLDISMPNLDGYELCSLLRKHPAFRDIPVVMVTGRSGFIDKARAKMVKSSGYLTKPFTKAQLLKTVFQQVGYLH
ncbi:response regulator [Brunnivagina elsteri]|uniref:Protein PatA n=1 Tax=Brunnivagina elsteri CCALA 953 TaxID=987040 RepID=A0A2A2TKM9_9CYAN|nr:response regulator [Calothrix elsteri]PAX56558.1 two-component system response regulator [Calothrix elsteri CCALA 953]